MTNTTTSATGVDQAWVGRYLRLLGVEREPPSRAALGRITAAHSLTVPFENFSSILRAGSVGGATPPPLDHEQKLQSWEQGRGGGVCFEVAEMVWQLLQGLGYRARPILCQISFPGSHQAVVVDLPDGRYLVDVGNGAPFFDPIALHGSVEIRGAGLAYRLHAGEAPETWVQERWIDGRWQPFCQYDLRDPEPGARQAAYLRHHTPGQSWVVDTPRLVRCTQDEVFALRDGEFTHYTATGKRTERIEGIAAHRRLVDEVFQLPSLPIEEALAAWAALEPLRRG
jgi:N-hydroxyarylamine O-acetyltransferase